jgi:16S rRNA (uracil1498-N3)-methyltransferase
VHRFFAPDLDPGDETVVLPRSEGEHLTRVLRLGVGDTVSVFDGRGREFLGRVAFVKRRDVRVTLVGRVEPVPEPTVPIVLAQAILKGDAMDEVVRDAVMLGVLAIQPLVTERTETTVASLLRGPRLDRWRRVALASVKQARRAVLPEIRSPLTLGSYLDEPRPAMTLMLVEPSAGAETQKLGGVRHLPVPPDAAVVIGPEGGWVETEWRAARERGVRLVSLGLRTLRADAAPVAAISVLLVLWDDP